MPTNSECLILAKSFYSHPVLREKTMFFEGPPGGGKSALDFQIADHFGIHRNNIVTMRGSLRMPTDLMGIPFEKDGLMHWAHPAELAQMMNNPDELWMLRLEEMPDAAQMMQNAMCGVIYDREVGGVTFGPNVIITANGNRTEDRSGAGRLISKLSNRVMLIPYEVSVDDWVEWALDNEIKATTVSFIHWKGLPALFDFDPERKVNATPRQWELVSYVDEMLPKHLFLAAVSGLVPEGLAVEYVAYKEIVDRLPSIDAIIADPSKAKLPDGIDVTYAIASRLITGTQDVPTFQSLMKYVERLATEYQTLYVHAVYKRVNEIASCKEYVQWCSKNASFFGAAA
jgi:hypothetical protein